MTKKKLRYHIIEVNDDCGSYATKKEAEKVLKQIQETEDGPVMSYIKVIYGTELKVKTVALSDD